MLRRARRSLRQVLSLMARRPALLCGAVVLAVLLVLAVKFTCSRAKNVVAAARPPLRFFSTEAPVVDLYLGQLDQVDRLRSMAEVSLIFFYAPWCAHSMAARQEVQLVAKKLAKQVQFVAVNCWWSQGKCRRQNQFYKYPTIHLFYRRFGPIEYKGPLVAPYVESFVLRVITPLTYLPSRASLEDFLSCHEPRVVGFFQFNSSPQPPGYVTYLSAALQALKRDFRGVVRFGVVTSRQVAERISVREDQTVYLHRRLNSSLIFPRWERNFTSSAISSWVFEHHESVLQWLQPPGTKSHLLEHELAKGPALLLFLPHNPLRSEPSPLLQQMADVAVRYHSCDTGAGSASRSPCCRSEVASPATVCEVCVAPPTTTNAATARRCCFKLLPAVSGGAEGCSNVQHSYSPFSLYSACCRRSGATHENRTRATEAPPAPSPPHSPPSPSASSSSSSSSSSSLTGLRCQTNRTLRFYVLDVALNWALAVRLGAAGNGSWAPPRLDPAAHADGSFATIVNLKDEVHYVLQRSPAHTLTESLEAFIRNFSAPYSLLQRHLVGEDPKQGGQEQAEQRQPPPPSPQQRRPLITELTTSSFLPSVMDIQRDVLLFYYTQWCGFCSVLNHVMIQLARLLQRNSTITVARVNVARNDLPWEFMVDHVPSILFFPRYRKHLSVKFPEELPITLPNLLDFILQHSGSPHYTDKPASAPGHCGGEAGGSGPAAVLRAEFVALQQEVQALHHARERLSQQLAQLWRENRQLALDARGLREHNGQLQRERRSLEEQHRLKSRQLGEALRRLQQLADASQSLLSHNAVLRLLLNTLKDRSEVAAAAAAAAAGEEAGAGAAAAGGAEPRTGHMAS